MTNLNNLPPQRRYTQQQQNSSVNQQTAVHPVRLTSDALRAHNHGSKVKRYFGCPNCDFFYWKTVYEFKPVSRCFKCHVKLDAIPIEFEVGKGYYQCLACENYWTSCPCRRDTKQPCATCNTMCLPVRMGPGKRKGPRKTVRRHRCENCVLGTCQTHTRRYSTIHDSTGSTISEVSTLFSVASSSFGMKSKQARRGKTDLDQ